MSADVAPVDTEAVCQRGHPIDGVTYRSSGRVSRFCTTCARLRRPLSERLVPTAPLREAVLASGISLHVICRELGWTRNCKPRKPGWKPYVGGDSIRLKRALGIAPHHDRRYGYTHGNVSSRIDYDLAVHIARIIGVDPVDVGL